MAAAAFQFHILSGPVSMNPYESLFLPPLAVRFGASSSIALWQSYRRRMQETDREFANALTAWENEGGSLAPAPRLREGWSEGVASAVLVLH